MTEIADEVGIALSYSNIRPFDIDTILAGWTSFGGYGGSDLTRSGFIFKMKPTGYCYVTVSRDATSHTTYVKNYPEYPFFLVRDRAANWITNEEELNANLPQAKSEAQNGVDRGTFRTINVGAMVRSAS